MLMSRQGEMCSDIFNILNPTFYFFQERVPNSIHQTAQSLCGSKI